PYERPPDRSLSTPRIDEPDDSRSRVQRGVCDLRCRPRGACSHGHRFRRPVVNDADEDVTQTGIVRSWEQDNLVRRTPALETWLQRLADGRPTVLPRLTSQGLALYGVTSSPAAARGLAAEMTAAIGPSWSDFDGASCSLDDADAFERALANCQEAGLIGPVLR